MLFRSNTMFIIVCVVPIPTITPVCCTTGMYMLIALWSHGKNGKIVLFLFSTPTLHGMQFYHVFNLIWRPNFGILSIRDNNRQEIRIHHSYRQMEYFFLEFGRRKIYKMILSRRIDEIQGIKTFPIFLSTTKFRMMFHCTTMNSYNFIMLS